MAQTRDIQCRDCPKTFRHRLTRGRPPLSCKPCRTKRAARLHPGPSRNPVL